MWSHLYGYYEIRGAVDYSITKNTKEMQAFLDGLPELRQTGLISYENALGHPWLSLSLVKSNGGNYAISDDTWNAEFNMIPIICSKSDNGKVPDKQIALLIKLAAALNWELVDEDDNDDIDYIVLYQPM